MTKSRFAGMTLNERLFEAGLLADFDDALTKGDRERLSSMLVAVDTSPGTADALLGLKYSCWFCGQGIERGGPPSLSIALADIWKNDSNSEPTQVIYSHFTCAAEQMKGASMSLEADILFADDGDP
jgi:hypothetical protein